MLLSRMLHKHWPVLGLSMALVACDSKSEIPPPAVESTQTRLSAAGGEAASFKRELIVSFPAASLAEDVVVSIVTDRTSKYEKQVGPLFNISTWPPVEFKKPVELRIRAPDARLAVRIARFDITPPAIVLGSTYDEPRHEARAQLTHFSTYGLMAVSSTTACDVDGGACEYDAALDAHVPSDATLDAGADTGHPDAPPDAAEDAAPDAQPDAAFDAEVDAGFPDAGPGDAGHSTDGGASACVGLGEAYNGCLPCCPGLVLNAEALVCAQPRCSAMAGECQSNADCCEGYCLRDFPSQAHRCRMRTPGSDPYADCYCAPNEACVPGGPLGHYCVFPSLAGESCNAPDFCAGGLYCNSANQTCQCTAPPPPPPPPSNCVELGDYRNGCGLECCSGLVAMQNRCVEPSCDPDLWSATCRMDRECCFGPCVDGFCDNDGRGCLSGSCPSYQFCYSHGTFPRQCTALPAAGEACAYNDGFGPAICGPGLHCDARDVCVCTPPRTGTCGNGVLEQGEQCDGADFGGDSCEARGELGILACTANCTIDASQCRIPFRTIAAGNYYSCGTKMDDTIRCWAHRGDEPGGEFVQVSVGRAPNYTYACGLRRNGLVECWGDGVGRTISTTIAFSQISVVCGVRTDGTLWCPRSLAIDPPPSGRFSSVSLGFTRSCAIRDDATKEVVCWGYGFFGGRPTGGGFTQVVLGETSECGLHLDGSIECWGDQSYGTSSTIPPPSGGGFVEIAADVATYCARRADGTLVCWGNPSSPNVHPPQGSFEQVVMGREYGCARKQDGTVTCWGNNYLGAASPP